MSILTDKIILDVAENVNFYFDESFDIYAFGKDKWKPRQVRTKGRLMNVTSNLRKSIKYKINKYNIVFVTDINYAKIHNEGGKIMVTDKMKGFFWAKYYSVNSTRLKNYYKALALKKVGSFIEIPKRQFIGINDDIDKIVKDTVTEILEKEFNKTINI